MANDARCRRRPPEAWTLCKAWRFSRVLHWRRQFKFHSRMKADNDIPETRDQRSQDLGARVVQPTFGDVNASRMMVEVCCDDLHSIKQCKTIRGARRANGTSAILAYSSHCCMPAPTE